MRLGGGFAAGLALGARVGADWTDRYKQASLEQGLADAAQKNNATEEVVGTEAQSKVPEIEAAQNEAGNQARDAALTQNPEDTAGAEQAGLAAARAYDPAVAEARRLGGKEAPGYVVGKRSFDSQAAAQAAADTANTRSMADVYRAHGHPEAAGALQRQAQSLEAGDLALKGARREDAVGEASQSLKLRSVKNQLSLMKQDFKNRVAAGQLKGVDLHKELIGAFADAADKNPAFANTLLKDSEFLGAIGVTDANYVPGSKDGIIFTLPDGTQQKTTISDIKAWRAGDQPLKTVTLNEGEAAFAVGKDGRAAEIARNPKTPDTSKEDGRIADDVRANVSQFSSSLISGKGMYASLDESQQARVTQAANDYQAVVGEYRDKFGKLPTIAEDATIRSKVAARYGFTVGKPKK